MRCLWIVNLCVCVCVFLYIGCMRLMTSVYSNMRSRFFLFEQKAWEVAQAPLKNLLMMGFMMWMAGSTVHLFSIGITFSALWQPISALQGVGKGMMSALFLFNTLLLFHLPSVHMTDSAEFHVFFPA